MENEIGESTTIRQNIGTSLIEVAILTLRLMFFRLNTGAWAGVGGWVIKIIHTCSPHMSYNNEEITIAEIQGIVLMSISRTVFYGVLIITAKDDVAEMAEYLAIDL